ncbi:hypothetical protein [Moorena sp. SIO1G6]|uniref:hypothetical protein n=1 Tax=Moorena sp. SIO1G6 TaxID=2607840 RepID=UPI00257F863A|nr:hypothetical protein [Moorena sp. SIO1G6]
MRLAVGHATRTHLLSQLSHKWHRFRAGMFLACLFKDLKVDHLILISVNHLYSISQLGDGQNPGF